MKTTLDSSAIPYASKITMSDKRSERWRRNPNTTEERCAYYVALGSHFFLFDETGSHFFLFEYYVARSAKSK